MLRGQALCAIQCRSKGWWRVGAGLILVGVDDTDTFEQGGTGRLARELARILTHALGGALRGVSRHQLLQDPRVPCTRKNQASCLSLNLLPQRVGSVVAILRDEVRRRAVPGSDPGICVATLAQVTAPVVAFGERVKRTFVRQKEALTLAARQGIVLEALGGTGDGVIGALAAVGLRVLGNDGRFTLLGGIRELGGVQPVSALLADGPFARVCDANGTPLPPGALVDTGGKVRPWLRDGEAVLVVEPGEGGAWRPVKRKG